MPEQTTAQTTIDLTPFCDPDSTRYAIAEPWVVDGWRYATDGRVLVRVPAMGEADTPKPEDGRRRPKDPADLIKPADGDWRPWPEVSECHNCDGVGNVACSGCECGKCDCDGTIKCDQCTDKGSFKTLFGEAELSRRYAWLIFKLPNVMYLPAASEETVRFKFDGGEGVTCSMRK